MDVNSHLNSFAALPLGKELEARWVPDILEGSDLCLLLGFKCPRSSNLWLTHYIEYAIPTPQMNK